MRIKAHTPVVVKMSRHISPGIGALLRRDCTTKNAIRLHRMRQCQHNSAILAALKNDARGIPPYMIEEMHVEPSVSGVGCGVERALEQRDPS